MDTATPSHDNFHLNNHELPPPAYELSDVELDRKIAAAAQRSLALTEQPQHTRPALPPIDEEGFPSWSDDLFEYNRQEREREEEQARNSKAQAEYRSSAQHHHSTSSASGSSSPPPVHIHTRPVNHARRSLPVIEEAMGINANKQKQDRLGWMGGNAQEIAQDEDEDPPMTAAQNVGRPSARVLPQLQVQVGPRAHDVLAQPQSPVSDPEDDVPGAELNRAPTYHPRGQPHPGHARIINERVSRRTTDSSGGLTGNGSVDLPAWTADAPSLEGPAYEEVMRTTTPASRPVPSPAPPSSVPPAPSRNERRQSGVQPQWKPVQARPQAQERVAGLRHSMMPTPTLQTWTSQAAYTTSPSSYTASPVTVAEPAPTPAPAPAPVHSPAPAPAPTPASAPTPFAGFPVPRPGAFDPGAVYRATQNYTLTGRKDFVFGSGIVDAQRELVSSGAHAFYNAAVVSTLTNAPFRTPPPPPQRTNTVNDDASSVRSGRSGSARQSMHSGTGARMSVYGAGTLPGGGVTSSVGTTLPVPITMPYPSVPTSMGAGGYRPGGSGEGSGGYQLPMARAGYHPGAETAGDYQPGGYQSGSGGGSQAPGAGGYQPNVQPGTAVGYQPQYVPSGSGAYQPQPGTYQAQPLGMYQPQAGTFNPQPSGTSYQPPLGAYQSQPSGMYQPQSETGNYQPQLMPTYQPQQMITQPGAPMVGQARQAAAPVQATEGLTALAGSLPKRGGKLYKKL